MASLTGIEMMLTYFPITPADVSELMPIENACHSHPWSENTFQSCIGGRYFGYYAKNTQQQTLGFYIGDYVAGEATLMDICVLPEQQGKGYGRALLQHFLQQAKQQNALKVFLEVRAKNISAQMLYINHGFIETDRRTGYYPSAKGFGYEDAIVMSLTL
jgi:ribosomal-protein-alanine N-acetyltransferase